MRNNIISSQKKSCILRVKHKQLYKVFNIIQLCRLKLKIIVDCNMDEAINQNEMCSNTLDKDLGVTIDENKHITQFDIIEQSIEDNQTTETLSYPEPNIENITSMIDESDDEPLLSIPPRPNNRKICSHYWLEILVGSIILIIVTMIVTAGVLFMKDFKKSSASTKGCDKKSETGTFFYYYLKIIKHMICLIIYTFR